MTGPSVDNRGVGDPIRWLDAETPQGPGRFRITEAAAPRALVVLGHGAGGGVEAPDLQALAERLPAAGLSVALFEQPWRTAGRRVAVAPPRLDEAAVAAIAQLRGEFEGLPLVLGGRSAGARVACRTGQVLEASHIVCLAFPLHPPGKPEKSRRDELLGTRVPTLVVQGSRDPFGNEQEMVEELAHAERHRMHLVEGARHDLLLPRARANRQQQEWEGMAQAVIEFVGKG
ncbi:alpha/beta family hydrolase [Luteococcus sp. OSA5]|uniref:alpha/beta hydrolase family protein n=1 Tax=Luteococcus sp. OSA5 TaxID=3401630 RepID=UPI003B42E267